MKLHYFVILLGVGLFLSSCITTQTVTKYTIVKDKEVIGTTFDELKGQTENYILRQLGAPKNQISDGAGGKILVYEDVTHVTSSSSSSSTSASLFYYGAQGSSNTQTTSTEKRVFAQFFIDGNSLCYDIKTSPEYYRYSEPEYGYAPVTERCIKKSIWGWMAVPYFGWIVAPLVVVNEKAKGCPYCE